MPQEHARIVTVTINPAVDKSSRVRRVVPDRKLRCDKPQFEPGGGGINVARAIHRLGGTAMALYPAGGYAGKLFDQLLEENGVDHQSVPIRETTRVNLAIREEETGQQFRFGMPGPTISPGEVQKLLGTLSDMDPQPQYVVVSGSLPPGVDPHEFHEQLGKLCQTIKARLVVDSSGPALGEAVRCGVYLAKPNLRELQELCERELEGESEIAHAAGQWIESGNCNVVVVSLGRGGAVLVTEKEAHVIPGLPVKARSRVGAGDSMVGGMILTLARDGSPLEAAHYGVAAGAAAVMTPGSELCRREDVERLLSQVRSQRIAKS